LKGNYTDLASAVAIDETDATVTKTQFMIHGANPLNSAEGLYEIVERADNG